MLGWLGAHIYDWVMSGPERENIGDWRARVLRGLEGSVLEIGAGTGANLKHYPVSLDRLVLLEPDVHMRARLGKKLASSGRVAELASGRAESLPFDDASFDWVVSTLVLCSVRDPRATLAELRRVLRPSGRLVFVEHVLDGKDAANRKRQERLQPLWGLLADNCQVIRDTERAIVEAGFKIESLEHERMTAGPRIVQPVILGSARLPSG